MFPLDFLFATVLITTPGIPCDAPPCPLPAFQAVAVSLDLLSEEECRYWFADPHSWEYDLRTIRENWQELRDAPPSCDRLRWPGKDFCRAGMDFNRAYYDWLSDHRAVDNRPWVSEAMEETEAAYAAWSLAEDFRQDYFSVVTFRRKLAELRDLVGPHAYYAGCLPPPVPVWRFNRIGE